MESRLPIISIFLIFKLFETFGQSTPPSAFIVGDGNQGIPDRLGKPVFQAQNVDPVAVPVAPVPPNELRSQSNNPSLYNFPWSPYQIPGYPLPAGQVPQQKYHPSGYPVPVPVFQPLYPPPGYSTPGQVPHQQYGAPGYTSPVYSPPGYPISQQPFQPTYYHGQGNPSPPAVSYAWPYQYHPQQQIYQPMPAPPKQNDIYLGSLTPTTPPCATILTSSNCVVNVPDNGQHHDILNQGFTFVGGLVKDQCSLTVRDSYGFYSTSVEYLHPSPYPAASVCCQCDGCHSDQFGLSENSCAILFENEKCSLCSGFRLEVDKGDSIMIMDPYVDNKASSIYVIPGCELTVYDEPNFGGNTALGMGLMEKLPNEWDNTISSYYCVCPDDYDTPPSEIASTPATLTTNDATLTKNETALPIPARLLARRSKVECGENECLY